MISSHQKKKKILTITKWFITCNERRKPIDDFSSRAPSERRQRPERSEKEIGSGIRHVPKAPLFSDDGQIRSAVWSLQVVMHLSPPFLVRDKDLFPRHERPRFHDRFRFCNTNKTLTLTLKLGETDEEARGSGRRKRLGNRKMRTLWKRRGGGIRRFERGDFFFLGLGDWEFNGGILSMTYAPAKLPRNNGEFEGEVANMEMPLTGWKYYWIAWPLPNPTYDFPTFYKSH